MGRYGKKVTSAKVGLSQRGVLVDVGRDGLHGIIKINVTTD